MKHLLIIATILVAYTLSATAQTHEGEQKVTNHTNPTAPVMELYDSYSRASWADYYLIRTKNTKRPECIGYDIKGKAFVVKANPIFALNIESMNHAVDRFMSRYTKGTAYAGKNHIEIVALAESGDWTAREIMAKAAKKSKGKLKDALPSVDCTQYDLKSRFGEFNQSGTMEPLEFQTEDAIYRYVKQQAKKFKYTQSVDMDEIYNRLAAGDRETVEFVNKRLSATFKK